MKQALLLLLFFVSSFTQAQNFNFRCIPTYDHIINIEVSPQYQVSYVDVSVTMWGLNGERRIYEIINTTTGHATRINYTIAGSRDGRRYTRRFFLARRGHTIVVQLHATTGLGSPIVERREYIIPPN